MKDKILFSIIIPTYNRASFIQKTILSALDQTYQNFEIIVVDDGSTDSTEEVVRNIKNEKIIFFKIKNSERGAARNFGASVAKGNYLNFFDSDDELHSNHLQEAFNLITKHNDPEFFHLGYDVKNDEGSIQNKVNNFDGDIKPRLIREGNLLSCNGVFLRSDIFKTNQFNEDRRLSGSEDYELWLRLCSNYNLYYSNEITSSIINHDERSVLHMNKEKLIGRFDFLISCLLQNKTFMKKFGKDKNIIIANGFSYISLHIALSGQYKFDVIKYLFKALVKHPNILFTKRFLAINKYLIFK